ncbi:hypothetical protein ACWD0J_22810 [Streptomyces sp. NPDC003011]
MNGPARGHATSVPVPAPGDTSRVTPPVTLHGGPHEGTHGGSHEGMAGRLPQPVTRRPVHSGTAGAPVGVSGRPAVDVAGPFRGRVRAGLTATTGPPTARTVPAAAGRRPATAVARVGWGRDRAGRTDDCAGPGLDRSGPLTAPGAGRVGEQLAARTVSAAAAWEAT